MSDTPTRIEINCETGAAVEVPLTAAEIAVRDQFAAAAAERIAAEETAKTAREALKVSAKAKLVAGEPLTEEEAAVLIL